MPGSEIAVYRTDAHGPAGNAFDAQGRLWAVEPNGQSYSLVRLDVGS